MKRIRGGQGLGDSLYLRPIAEHFVRTGESVVVYSNYADIFQGSGADVYPFSRNNIDVLAHYTAGKSNPDSTQWADVCRSAGVDVPLSFAWTVKKPELISDLRATAGDNPIILVHGGRAPYGRTDGYGLELVPRSEAFKAVTDALGDECLLIQIGKDGQIYPIDCDIDLIGKTSVSDLLDLGRSCDGIVAQCSFAIPLAEVFDKPFLGVWSARGLASQELYVRRTTPKKLLSKPTSGYVVDDWTIDKIQELVHAFCHI